MGAVELRNAIASKYSIVVPATLAFDYPTASSLTEYVTAHQSSPSSPTTSDALPQTGLAASLPTLDIAGIADAVSRIVSSVLGITVPVEQPLMEVDHRNPVFPLDYSILLAL